MPAGAHDGLAEVADALAHRLATPARIVSGNARVLAAKVAADDRDVVDALAALERGSRWVDAIVDGLTRYARVGDPLADLQPVDAAQECRDAVELLAREVAASGAQVSIEALPALVAEPRALRTLFRCLLDNALKADATRVVVACTEEPSAWHLTVADDGVGVPLAERERVFEPFACLRAGGAGLGLTLARAVVERHGGAISLDETPGGGTTARVTLPRDAQE